MRKFIASLGLIAVALALSAQEKGLGTKAEVKLPQMPESNTGSVGFLPLLQMVVALGIVLAIIKWLLPKMLGKVNKKVHTRLTSSIEIEESASFAGGQLLVVKARGRTLLLCSNGAQVSCLADLTEGAPLHTDEPAFFEVVDQAQKKPESVLAAVLMNEETDEDQQRRIDRLQRLEAAIRR